MVLNEGEGMRVCAQSQAGEYVELVRLRVELREGHGDGEG